MRVCVCATQVAFEHGGAEALCDTLCRELRERDFEADLVTVPFTWTPRIQILKSALLWRLLGLANDDRRPDLAITTRFPSYLVQHPNKVVWLIHQFRQVYDLLGTQFSDFDDSARDRNFIARVKAMDRLAFRESSSIYTISHNVAERLRKHNGLEARVLHPPSKLGPRLHAGSFGDYILSVGRLDELKRVDLVIEAVAAAKTPVRCKIAGEGKQRPVLEALIEQHGLTDRVELLGRVCDEQLIELYANCLAVVYTPYDEDYGYVTIEALGAAKPVLTASDSGAVLEFVEHGRNGFIHHPDDIAGFGRSIDLLFRDRDKAGSLGAGGPQTVGDIRWDHVIQTLTGVSPTQ